MLRVSPFLIALIGTVLYVLVRGEREERLTAAAIALAAIASVPGVAFWSSVEFWIWGVDAALLGFLLWLALRSDKFWPLWAAGFHMPSVLTHLAVFVDPQAKAWAYATMAVIWNILVLAALATGTYFEVVKRRTPNAPSMPD